ncbi:UNKNOWN [Stylonychia lemnae]|uniref:TLDc domain-containing protein n=1 Tax=Stylonychia lemnae TaxID=5949 RepID=A0A078ARC8_STYLE|nr:UNKNOWN [Stylonychia lemnae]|eukprot:CDW83398.1 UNKNOWN [Stylonychia lemnae]
MGFNDIQNLNDSGTPNPINNRLGQKNMAKSAYLEEQKQELFNVNGINYSSDSNLSMSCYNFGSLSQNETSHQLSRSHSAPLKSGFKKFLEDSQIVINQQDKQNLLDMIKANHSNPSNLKISSSKIFDGKQYGMISTLLSKVIDQYSTQQSIFILKSNYGRIFGLVSRLLIQKQKLHNDTLCDNQSFIFSITHNTQHKLLKQNTFGVKIKSEPYYKMSHSDICIGYNFSERGSCKSYLGTYYQLPKGMEYDLKGGEIYLAGASQFAIESIEVFILDENID